MQSDNPRFSVHLCFYITCAIGISACSGGDKVYKGTCQLFEETLMCVRNQPIEYLTPLYDPKLASVKDNESITLQK